MDRADERLKGIFKQIESADFESDVAVESGFERAVRRIVAHPAVRQLISELKDDEFSNASGLVLERIRSLSVPAVDPRYRNRFDTALAAYLVVLAVASQRYARVGRRLARAAGNTWLSKKAASVFGRGHSTYSKEFSSYKSGRPLWTGAEIEGWLAGAIASQINDWPGLSGRVIEHAELAKTLGSSNRLERYLASAPSLGPSIPTENVANSVSEVKK